jgi:hypothetical protein
MYSIGELAVARQHNLPVTWLIIDDGGYGILREYMTEAFGAATATLLARPNFLALEAKEVISAYEPLIVISRRKKLERADRKPFVWPGDTVDQNGAAIPGEGDADIADSRYTGCPHDHVVAVAVG